MNNKTKYIDSLLLLMFGLMGKTLPRGRRGRDRMVV